MTILPGTEREPVIDFGEQFSVECKKRIETVSIGLYNLRYALKRHHYVRDPMMLTPGAEADEILKNAGINAKTTPTALDTENAPGWTAGVEVANITENSQTRVTAEDIMSSAPHYDPAYEDRHQHRGTNKNRTGSQIHIAEARRALDAIFQT